MKDDIKVLTKGRWPSILMQLGVPRDALSGRDVPCPMCNGKDRFRFSDFNQCGGWYCRQCGGKDGSGGGGDGFRLIMALKHVNFRGACDLVEEVIGKAALTRIKPERVGEEQARAAMKWQWENAKGLTGVDPASAYLARRLITVLPPPSAVRYAESVPDYDPITKKKTYRPALLSRMIGEDRAVLHIIFLTQEGVKAETRIVKRFFAGAKVPPGGSVRLGAATGVLGVATGLETSLSAAQKLGMTVWATLTDVAMFKFEPPPGCDELFIFPDADEAFQGHIAGYSLGNRLAKRPHLKVRVELPPKGFKDWNDVIVAEHDASNVVRIA